MDASADDAAKVERQLGPSAGTLDREPDITVRFVEAVHPQAAHVRGSGPGRVQ